MAVFRRASIPLIKAPRIGGQLALQVSYAPFIDERMVLFPDKPNDYRLMTAAEQEEVDEKLERMGVIGASVWD